MFQTTNQLYFGQQYGSGFAHSGANPFTQITQICGLLEVLNLIHVHVLRMFHGHINYATTLIQELLLQKGDGRMVSRVAPSVHDNTHLWKSIREHTGKRAWVGARLYHGGVPG